MTTDEPLGLEDEGTPDPPCVRCGHGESEHVLRDAEVAGDTIRRVLCESCDDWHEFVPDPRDL